MSHFDNAVTGFGLSRRSFLAGVAAVALGGASAAFLAACGSSEPAASTAASAAGSAETSAAATSAAASGTTGSKTLVAYFSGTGHTEKAAKAAADALGADLFVITPANAYSDDDLNYNDDDSRVVQEYQNEDQRDTELTQNAPDNWADYSTVLVGYPIWWGDSAWAMWRFASENDFTGKTVVPFCTSFSSGLGDSGTNLAKRAGTGDWQEGHRFDQEVEDDEVQKWAKGLDI